MANSAGESVRATRSPGQTMVTDSLRSGSVPVRWSSCSRARVETRRVRHRRRQRGPHTMAENTSTETVDAVVVGSGFGGSVAAYRLADAGRSVVVLERGRAYPPGSFPRTPSATARELLGARRGPARPVRRLELRGHRRPGLQRPGRRLADLRQRAPAQGREVVRPRAAGAGRRLRALADLPRRPRAPLRRGRVDDRRHARIPTTTRPRRWRSRRPPRRPACRCSARRWRSASRAGRGRSRCGRARSSPRRTATSTACRGSPARLTGECDVGCNNGAKNTLDHTYLSAAKHAGADIRTRHEVKGFRPLDADGGGYEVTYVVHTGADGEPAVDLPVRTIRARRLVLAAGTFGTTYLLLRNRLALPGLSGALGTRFSGNGDLLGLSWTPRATASPATSAPTPARSSPPRSGSPTRSTATAPSVAGTTWRTPATRRSRPGSPRAARAWARWLGRSSSATGGRSRTCSTPATPLSAPTSPR